MGACEVAWATGLFEGEGSIVAARRRERHYARLIVYSTDRDVLERWRAVFGGLLYERKQNRQALGSKTAYYIEIGSQEDVRRVVDAMLPLLGARRRAQVAAVYEKVDANPEKKYRDGWARRRELYGTNGRS